MTDTPRRLILGVLWLAAGYGLFGAVVCVIAALMTGERMWWRVGAGLVVLGAAGAAGLVVSRNRARVTHPDDGTE